MTHAEIQKMTAGKFTKVAQKENSIVIGTIGSLNAESTTHEVILYFARYYNINTEPDKFRYHMITAEGAVKRGCKLPTSNYNEFIEIFK